MFYKIIKSRYDFLDSNHEIFEETRKSMQKNHGYIHFRQINCDPHKIICL